MYDLNIAHPTHSFIFFSVCVCVVFFIIVIRIQQYVWTQTVMHSQNEAGIILRPHNKSEITEYAVYCTERMVQLRITEKKKLGTSGIQSFSFVLNVYARMCCLVVRNETEYSTV